MQITFYRQGYANNSSSSHSIIFSDKDISTQSDEDEEFGWQYFTCSSRADKIGYIHAALYHTYYSLLQLQYNYELVGYGANIQENLYREWYAKSKLHDILGNVPETIGSIDHQSEVVFPADRNKLVPHLGFIRAFAHEFLDKNYAILGGNDNDEGTHSLADRTGVDTDLMRFWRSYQEVAASSMRCKFDELTNEFVISNANNGNLVKLKF